MQMFAQAVLISKLQDTGRGATNTALECKAQGQWLLFDDGHSIQANSPTSN